MDNPPGRMARRIRVPCDRNGRVQLPIASRGAGTYIVAVDRRITAPALVRRNPNGAPATRPYDFSDTGRSVEKKKTNSYHLLSGRNQWVIDC